MNKKLTLKDIAIQSFATSSKIIGGSYRTEGCRYTFDPKVIGCGILSGHPYCK